MCVVNPNYWSFQIRSELKLQPEEGKFKSRWTNSRLLAEVRFRLQQPGDLVSMQSVFVCNLNWSSYLLNQLFRRILECQPHAQVEFNTQNIKSYVIELKRKKEKNIWFRIWIPVLLISTNRKSFLAIFAIKISNIAFISFTVLFIIILVLFEILVRFNIDWGIRHHILIKDIDSN